MGFRNLAVRAIGLASGYDWWYSSIYRVKNLIAANSEAASVVRHLIRRKKQDKEMYFTLFGSILIWGSTTFAIWWAKHGPVCCVQPSGLLYILYGLMPVSSLLHKQAEIVNGLQLKQDDRDRHAELRRLYLLAEIGPGALKDAIKDIELRSSDQEILEMLQLYIWEIPRILIIVIGLALVSFMLAFMLGEGVAHFFCHISDEVPRPMSIAFILVISSCWGQATILFFRMEKIEQKLNEACDGV